MEEGKSAVETVDKQFDGKHEGASVLVIETVQSGLANKMLNELFGNPNEEDN